MRIISHIYTLYIPPRNKAPLKSSRSGLTQYYQPFLALDLLIGTLRPRLPFLRNNSLRMWS